MTIINRHQQEWLQSAVDPGIIKLNVTSLSPEDTWEHLFISDKIDRLNTGRLSRRWQKKYEFLDSSDGGWWCSGVDPLDEYRSMEWGCLKPDRPRLDFEKKKPIKYEHPPKTPTRAFFLRVPDQIWEKVAQRYGKLVTDEDRKWGFWFWVWLRNIPIIIVEGAKKAGCLLTLGYAAIALPGITGGVRSTKDANGNKINICLIPDLQHFDTLGRKVSICFDNDPKQATKQNVNYEIKKLGELYTASGCEVNVIGWSSPEKGVDDFVIAQGGVAFDETYKNAVKFEFWLALQMYALTYTPKLLLNQRYLGKLKLPKTGLVVIKSPKGTGKTEALVDFIGECNASGRKVLVLTHRKSLGRAICDRIGIDWIESMRTSETEGVFGFGLCVDSLHPLSQARFHPNEWVDSVVILDECEQVMWHALSSSTCRDNRVTILKNFTELVQTVLASSNGLVIAQDADMSDVSVDYLKAVAGIALNPYVIVNEWKPTRGWDVTIYNTKSPAELYSELERVLKQAPPLTLGDYCDLESRGECCPLASPIKTSLILGDYCDITSREVMLPPEPVRNPILVLSDSQKVKGQWSCRNLESQLLRKFPDYRILRIDSESVGNPEHPAFCCIERINDIIKDYDIVIASPSINTGVSIDLRGYFKGVFGIFKGAIASTDVLQFLSRLRDENVPRYVWCKKVGVGKIANGSTSYRNIYNTKMKVIKTNLALLNEVDFDIDNAHDPIHARTYCKMAARINAGIWNYRQDVCERLQAEGHNVRLCRENQLDQEIRELKNQLLAAHQADDDCAVEEIRNKLEPLKQEFKAREETASYNSVVAKLTTQKNRQRQGEGVERSQELSHSQYQESTKKSSKTLAEIYAEQKYFLKLRYGVAVTADLCRLDEDGLYPKIRMHYYLTDGEEFLAQSDRSHLAGHVQRGNGQVCLQDISLMSAKVAAFKKLGLMQFLDPTKEFSNDSPEVIAVAEDLKKYNRDFKTYLNLTINPALKPMDLVQYCLRQLIRAPMRCVRKERTEERTASNRQKERRIYQWQMPNDGRQDVFAAWHQRDLEIREKGVAPATGSNINTETTDPVATLESHLKVGDRVRWGSATIQTIKELFATCAILEYEWNGRVIEQRCFNLAELELVSDAGASNNAESRTGTDGRTSDHQGWDVASWTEALSAGIQDMRSAGQDRARSVWEGIKKRCSHLASGIWMNLDESRRQQLKTWGCF